MLHKSDCAVCQGTGVQMVQTSAVLGLLKRSMPAPCGTCSGAGYSLTLPACKICQGRGLVGNESEICRSCNGTGHIDSFSMIPAELLKPGTLFHRRCEDCSSGTFEVRSPIESRKVYKTWDAAEELREYELIEKVTVGCTQCSNTYDSTVDPAFHKLLDTDTAMELERLGLDLSFLYQSGQPRAARQEQLQA